MSNDKLYTAFAGARCIASGPLRDLLPVLKKRFDRDNFETILVFEDESGQQVDFNLRGSVDEVLDRHAPTTRRGPGRPRLGVKSREVSLLPRHWDWLEQQPKGISATLRRLIDQAARSEPGPARAKRIRAALGNVLTALAGDRPNFEDACRALYAGKTGELGELIARWPKDIRDYAQQRAARAAQLDEE